MQFLIIAVVIAFVLTLPTVKGFWGELIVNGILRLLSEKEYTLFKDIYISKEDGTTAQIDHVIVSRYGIFVIETKNYKGWIFGDEKSKNWTQVIYQHKSKFLNPIIQNKGHIKAIKKYLGYSQDEYYYSIIAFTHKATLKKIITETPVIYSTSLIREISKNNSIILSDEELKDIIVKLSSIKKVNFKDKSKHVNEIKTKINKRICARCGSDLIIRNGKNGEFYGCMRYPNCRYTENK